MIQDVSPYVQAFVSLKECVESTEEPDNCHPVIYDVRRPHSEHIRWYNRHKTSEVSVVVPNAEVGIVERRGTVLLRWGDLNSNASEVSNKVSVTYRYYERVRYVLPLPFGQDGWDIQLTTAMQHSQLSSSQSVSIQTTPPIFYCYHLYGCSTDFSNLHREWRLFQQYNLHKFCKMESGRLSHYPQIHQQLRVADNMTLCEQLADPEQFWNEAEVVRPVIYSSSHLHILMVLGTCGRLCMMSLLYPISWIIQTYFW